MTNVHQQLHYFFRGFIEKRIFTFCSELATRMNLSAFSVRSYFMYTSFLAYNSPLLINMSYEFLLHFNKHFRRRRSLVGDL